MTRLEQQMNFILEIDRLKDIQRQTYLHHGKRKENDAEHSYHLALMAIVLSEHANHKVDLSKVVTMVLIHDIIEIDAGDTYAYDENANKTKRDREVKAADRLFSLLPKDQAEYFRAVWEEFEAAQTEEALFALALDKVQPTMLNDAADGKAWAEHNVGISQILSRNSSTSKGSEALWEFALSHFIEPHITTENKIGAIRDDR